MTRIIAIMLLTLAPPLTRRTNASATLPAVSPAAHAMMQTA